MAAYNATEPRGHRSVKSRIGVNVEGLSAFLRQEHPYSTAAHVEARTSIPARTVEGWLEGRGGPSLAAFLALAYHYGPALAAAAYPNAPDWLNEAKSLEEERELERQRDEAVARLEAMRQAR